MKINFIYHSCDYFFISFFVIKPIWMRRSMSIYIYIIKLLIISIIKNNISLSWFHIKKINTGHGINCINRDLWIKFIPNKRRKHEKCKKRNNFLWFYSSFAEKLYVGLYTREFKTEYVYLSVSWLLLFTWDSSAFRLNHFRNFQWTIEYRISNDT